MDSIGARIKIARENRNMTQSELGKICGTTKQTIYKYETGIVTNIPMDRLQVIAQALDVTPAYLMGWSNEQNNAVANRNTNTVIFIGRDGLTKEIHCSDDEFAKLIADFDSRPDASDDL